MQKQKCKLFKKFIKNKKGETLIESVVSILIFSIVVLTVSFLTVTAVRITSSANATSALVNAHVNSIVGQDAANTVVEQTATFENAASGINADQKVDRVTDKTIIGFYPQ